MAYTHTRRLWHASVVSLLLILASFCSRINAKEDHSYERGDQVVLYVNKVGPYNNPQGTRLLSWRCRRCRRCLCRRAWGAVKTLDHCPQSALAQPSSLPRSLAPSLPRSLAHSCLRLFSLSETYAYYSLPFCRPSLESPKTKWSGLGSVLQGNELVDSQLELKFRVPTPVSAICEQTLSASDATTLGGRIGQHYWYELFLDGLPVWGFVGPPPEHTVRFIVDGWGLVHVRSCAHSRC